MTDSRIERLRRNRSVAHGSIIWLASALLHIGCLMPGAIEPSPWTYSEQQQEILKLVPVGTPRDAAVERLQKAGIDGTFGVSDTVYYCDIWNRPDGERWHLNVALYFDDEGLLYDSRLGQAETGLIDESEVDSFLPTDAEATSRKQDQSESPYTQNSLGSNAHADAPLKKSEDASSETSGRRGIREPYSKQAF